MHVASVMFVGECGVKVHVLPLLPLSHVMSFHTYKGRGYTSVTRQVRLKLCDQFVTNCTGLTWTLSSDGPSGGKKRCTVHYDIAEKSIACSSVSLVLDQCKTKLTHIRTAESYNRTNTVSDFIECLLLYWRPTWSRREYYFSLFFSLVVVETVAVAFVAAAA